jgi:serine/threonine-protein kinase
MRLQNRYEIIQELGEGGFGKAFIAEDTQMPSHRKCVIKQLKPISNNPNIYQIIQERFNQEAIILEKLGTENKQIPSLYAYFEEDNLFYLVQEYVEGVTLTNLVQQKGVLSESEVRDFLLKVLPVFDFIHSQGIIHRDTKPDNLILRLQDQLPVLIDFGAVKETMATIVSNSGTPTSSIIIGSPGFMPSEQSIGRPVFATDIYALGLTAIFLLTRKYPSELSTNQITGEIQWLEYCKTPVTAHFAAILNKAIASHHKDRYLKAKEMLDALQGKPISNPPPPVPNPTPPQPTTPSYPQPTVVSNSPQQVTPNYPQQISSAYPQQTIPVYPQNKVMDNQNNRIIDHSNRSKDWHKGLIIGSFVGLLMMFGIVLIASFSSFSPLTSNKNEDNNNKPSNSNQNTTELSRQIDSNNNQDPSQNSSQNPSTYQNQRSVTTPNYLPSSIGWLRLGAVNNTSEIISTGEPLIATIQPVSIAPLLVPSIGDEVTVITGVNLRANFPQPPNYKLPQKLSSLTPGQKLIILRVEPFIDHTVSSNYAVVWAEVGLP